MDGRIYSVLVAYTHFQSILSPLLYLPYALDRMVVHSHHLCARVFVFLCQERT